MHISCQIRLSELQARWFASNLAGHTQLPPRRVMEQQIEKDRVARESRFYGSPRHSLEIDYHTYMSQIAEYLGVLPNLKWLCVFDPRLAYYLTFGMYSTYQFRLQGRHKWEGARKAILELDSRIDGALQTVRE